MKEFLILCIISAIFCVIMAIPVMLLWNSIIPDIFHLSKITYLQALNLFLLINILFNSKITYKNGK